MSGWSVHPPIVRVAVEPDVATDCRVPPPGTPVSCQPAVHGAAQVARGSSKATVTVSTNPSWSLSIICIDCRTGAVVSPACAGSTTLT